MPVTRALSCLVFFGCAGTNAETDDPATPALTCPTAIVEGGCDASWGQRSWRGFYVEGYRFAWNRPQPQRATACRATDNLEDFCEDFFGYPCPTREEFAAGPKPWSVDSGRWYSSTMLDVDYTEAWFDVSPRFFGIRDTGGSTTMAFWFEGHGSLVQARLSSSNNMNWCCGGQGLTEVVFWGESLPWTCE